MGIKFSIIIPTCKADNLDVCLAHISAIEYPHDRFECLVCDNAGDAVLEKKVAVYSKKYPFIRYIKADAKRSAYYARNIGVAKAFGEYMCFTDDDCAVPPGWLSKIEELLSGGADLVNTRVVPGYDNIWEKTIENKNTCQFEKRFYSGKLEGIVFPTKSVIVKKNVLEEMGGFKEIKRGADAIFSREFIATSKKFAYLKDPVIRHYAVAGFGDFAKKAFAFGYSSVTADTHKFFSKGMTAKENLKFMFVEVPLYLGGMWYLGPLLIYSFFRMCGILSAKLRLFKDNPVE